MSDEHNMTITEILALADEEGFDVYKGAVVLGSAERGFEVHHGYGDANVSCWSSHEEARQEAARLWAEGLTSYIDDFVVRQAGVRIAARVEELGRRMQLEDQRIRADLRAA
jgi:hypothetical protein